MKKELTSTAIFFQYYKLTNSVIALAAVYMPHDPLKNVVQANIQLPGLNSKSQPSKILHENFDTTYLCKRPIEF